jgi:hypothetical protein
MLGDCATRNGDHGGRGHNAHYCVGCGLLLGVVTRAQVIGYYADGSRGAVDAPALDGYYERLGLAWG